MKENYIQVLESGNLTLESRSIGSAMYHYAIRVNGTVILTLTLPDSPIVEILETAYRVNYYTTAHSRHENFSTKAVPCAIVKALMKIGSPEHYVNDTFTYYFDKLIIRNEGKQSYPRVLAAISPLFDFENPDMAVEAREYYLTTNGSDKVYANFSFRKWTNLGQPHSPFHTTTITILVSGTANPLNYEYIVNEAIRSLK